MNYATIKTHDVANGPGVRVSLFVSGCRHHCPGCFNAEAWDFSYGQPFTQETEANLLSALAPDYIKGFSLLGGEPFEPDNRATLAPLLKKIRYTYPAKTIWCYTGFLLDQELLGGKAGDMTTIRQMLDCIDVLVDGRYIEEKKDLNLRFRGSANQRIIHVPNTIKNNKIVLIDHYMNP